MDQATRTIECSLNRAYYIFRHYNILLLYMAYGLMGRTPSAYFFIFGLEEIFNFMGTFANINKKKNFYWKERKPKQNQYDCIAKEETLN